MTTSGAIVYSSVVSFMCRAHESAQLVPKPIIYVHEMEEREDGVVTVNEVVNYNLRDWIGCPITTWSCGLSEHRTANSRYYLWHNPIFELPYFVLMRQLTY